MLYSYNCILLISTYICTIIVNLFTDTSKNVIDHFNHYMTTEMDSDLIVEDMLSQQLLNDQEVYTIMSATSSFQKNCLILEKIRPMNIKSLLCFCKILQKFDSQKHIADALLNGK